MTYPNLTPLEVAVKTASNELRLLEIKDAKPKVVPCMNIKRVHRTKI